MKYGSSGKTSTQVNNRKRSLSSERQVTRQNNYRTPSPRFDPTAYVTFAFCISAIALSVTFKRKRGDSKKLTKD